MWCSSKEDHHVIHYFSILSFYLLLGPDAVVHARSLPLYVQTDRPTDHEPWTVTLPTYVLNGIIIARVLLSP